MKLTDTFLDLIDMSNLDFFEEADELLYQAERETNDADALGAIDMLAKSLVRASHQDEFLDTIDYVYGNHLSYLLTGKDRMLINNLLDELLSIIDY